MNHHGLYVIAHMLLVETLVSMHEVDEVEDDEVDEVHLSLHVSLPILCVSVEHIRKNLECLVSEEILQKRVVTLRERLQHELFL